MTLQKRKKMTLYMKVFFAALISLIQIMPIVVVVVNSFRGNDEISKLMLGFPTKFHFENYAVAWTRGGYAYAYASSLIIGFARGTTICHKFCISDAPSMRAASSSSFDIPSKNADIKVKLNGILIPIYIKIIPIWVLIRLIL